MPWASERQSETVQSNYQPFMVKDLTPKKAENLFRLGYNTELDTSPELEPDSASYYLTFINIIRWSINHGWIDMITNVSLFLSHGALHREGHLDAAVYILADVS